MKTTKQYKIRTQHQSRYLQNIYLATPLTFLPVCRQSSYQSQLQLYTPAQQHQEPPAGTRLTHVTDPSLWFPPSAANQLGIEIPLVLYEMIHSPMLS